MEESYCEKERNRLDKLRKFQLPNYYKRIGVISTIVIFALMIAKKFVEEPEWVKPVLTNLLLVSMLIISLSKDKIEDEYIDSLRSQSYRIAFILVVLYTFIQPAINYVVSLILGEETDNGFSYFQALFFMLIVQLMFFYKLKKFNR